MRRFTTKIGDKFNYLTIKEFTRKQYYGKDKNQFVRYCLAECECGTIKEYALNNIKSGRSKSCGCKHYEGCKQGASKHPLYKTYSSMMTRCYNIKDESYGDYGGRGIKVCNRWRKSFFNFLADMGDKPSMDYSIDRIDVNGDYKPSNCRWATREQQMNNTRKSALLTPRKLAKVTGYTPERIRQLTGLGNNRCVTDDLVPYIKSIEKTENGYYNVVYKEESIQYLMQKRQ